MKKGLLILIILTFALLTACAPQKAVSNKVVTTKGTTEFSFTIDEFNEDLEKWAVGMQLKIIPIAIIPTEDGKNEISTFLISNEIEYKNINKDSHLTLTCNKLTRKINNISVHADFDDDYKVDGNNLKKEKSKNTDYSHIVGYIALSIDKNINVDKFGEELGLSNVDDAFHTLKNYKNFMCYTNNYDTLKTIDFYPVGYFDE